MILEKVFADIKIENIRQETLHPDSKNTEPVWGLVLTEEVGEVAKAALNKLFSSNSDTTKQLYEELIQVATVAAAWATDLAENNPHILK